jgi:RimJ/RimL family protein N-acetyltransferase/acyl carrier protein
MKEDKLLKKLNIELPVDNNDEIIFTNLLQSKKYYKDFFLYSKSKKFYEFFEYSPPKNKKTFLFFVKKLIKIENSNYKNETYQKFWLIIDKKNDKLVGSAKLTNLNPIRKSIEWGYGINPKFWGNNYILNIQLALLNYVFNKLNLNRLHGKTHIKNKRVIKGIEKLGFKKEGINSDYYYHQKKNKFFDAYSYALLKSDFIKNKIIRKDKKNNNKITDELNFISINKVISKVLKKKLSLEKNIKMNDIVEWDSIYHFDIVSSIEKKFNKKFSNEEILKSSSTESIYKIIKKITLN